jgi:Lrp/AsnC family transcriptional regulator, leucine-responsive regulatory protein
MGRISRLSVKIGPQQITENGFLWKFGSQNLSPLSIIGKQLKDFLQMAHKSVPNRIDLDAIAWKILEALQQNARISFAELGRKISLSTPAVAERVHRLEEAGVITGYHASLDSAKLGVPIRVLVRLTIPGGELQINRTIMALRELSEISRCHRITGDESFVIEADVVSIRHLEALIDRLSALGATSTSTVLSSPVERRDHQAKQIELFAKYI